MVHTGACIASLLGQGGSRKYHLTWKGLRYFKNDRDRRDLITCGAAAGVAAAFRAPVGGVLFALEEAASWSHTFPFWGVRLISIFIISFRVNYSRVANLNCDHAGGGVLFCGGRSSQQQSLL